MMFFRSSDALKILLIALLFAVTPCTSFAQEESDEGKGANASTVAMETATIVDAIRKAQEMLSGKMQTIFDDLRAKILSSKDEIKDTIVSLWKEEVRRKSQGLGSTGELLSIAQERAKSAIMTDAARQALDEVNYKLLEGYRDIPGVGYYGDSNPNLRGKFSTIGRIYDLHVKLFCDPRGVNVPPGCGGGRGQAGINGNENFIDFMVSERTWPKEAILDTLQVARAYFMEMKPRFSAINADNSPAGMVAWQRSAARDNIRMAVLNMLAARRAPTSEASQDVMRMMLRNFAVTGKVSSIDLAKLCAKSANELNDLEAYTCNMTNIPDKAGDPRIIGQAGIDRVMQHDYYLSPLFYSTLNSPSIGDGVNLERMEVLNLSQQLAQDYYLLRMLQMKTVLRAIRLAPKD